MSPDTPQNARISLSVTAITWLDWILFIQHTYSSVCLPVGLHDNIHIADAFKRLKGKGKAWILDIALLTGG